VNKQNVLITGALQSTCDVTVCNGVLYIIPL